MHSFRLAWLSEHPLRLAAGVGFVVVVVIVVVAIWWWRSHNQSR
jgi:uncharacterized membrane protein YqiK